MKYIHFNDGARYYTLITKRWHLTMRLGVEHRPLFSERNKVHQWFYFFGRRLSFRVVRNGQRRA